MNAPLSPVSIQHNAAESRFEAMVDGYQSVADYVIRDKTMIFTHTFVPPELRGRGVAEKLVRAGLAEAKAKGLTVVPACSYAAGFISRHKEFQELLEGGAAQS